MECRDLNQHRSWISHLQGKMPYHWPISLAPWALSFMESLKIKFYGIPEDQMFSFYEPHPNTFIPFRTTSRKYLGAWSWQSHTWTTTMDRRGLFEVTLLCQMHTLILIQCFPIAFCRCCPRSHLLPWKQPLTPKPSMSWTPDVTCGFTSSCHPVWSLLEVCLKE